jgi:hypothetical protein
MKQDNHEPKKRPVRVPLHQQSSLTSAERDGYKRYWFNDTMGRIDAAKRAGWTHVLDEEANTSDVKAQSESQFGSAICQVTNRDPNASSHKSYLMEIPIDFFNEDYEAQQKLIDEKEASYDPNGLNKTMMNYGKMAIKRG